MAWRAYNTVNGQILGETSSSGARPVDYQLDALGSVVGTIKTNGTLENTYRWAGYGQQVSKTGIGSDPTFQWVGGWGYRKTDALSYVRRRHLAQKHASWSSVDSFWPYQPQLRYAHSSPVSYADASGLAPEFIGCDGVKGAKLSDCCRKMAPGSLDRTKVKECMKRKGFGFPYPVLDSDVDWFLDVIQRYCSGTGANDGSNRVCVRCGGPDNDLPSWPSKCPNPCKTTKNLWGIAYPPGPQPLPAGIKDRCELVEYGPPGPECSDIYKGPTGRKCACSVVICDRAFTNLAEPGIQIETPCAILYHELAHCSTLGHPAGEEPIPGIDMSRSLDFVYKLGCCICKANYGEDQCGKECSRITKS